MTASAQSAPQTGQHLAASIGRSTVFGIVANFVQMGTRLVTVPVAIQHLGLGGYGIWNVIMMTANYMRFGSVGVKTAFQKYVAEATGDGSYERANELLSTGCAIMLGLSVAGLIPTALFSRQIAAAAGVPPEFLVSTSGAIALLALIMMMANTCAAFEAIVMGAHRIDLVRKFGALLSVAEAAAIVIALHLGFGLFTMAAIMGASELVYLCCCYAAAVRVLPQIQLRLDNIRRSVVSELFRFAGSYQLVNLLEVLYNSLLPVAMLRAFGADSAGVYAVATRVTASATMLPEAFFPPILSGGTMIFASGSAVKIQGLLTKAFKVTLALSLFPLGFIALFGSTIAYAWTGNANPMFRAAFYLVSIRAGFASLSLLSLVLYRASGKALWDNLRQVLRIAIILITALFARELGFYGVLAGMAVAEGLGLIFMLGALRHTFRFFRLRSLLPEAGKVITAAGLILGFGSLAALIPLPVSLGERQLALARLIEVFLASSLLAWPMLLGTGCLTAAEGMTLASAFLPRRSNKR